MPQLFKDKHDLNSLLKSYSYFDSEIFADAIIREDVLKDNGWSYYYLDFYLSINIDTDKFPQTFYPIVDYIKEIEKGKKIMNMMVENPDQESVFSQITLYQLVKKYKKIPNRILTDSKCDIFELIGLYEEHEMLKRFLHNKGKVFYSESMKSMIYPHLYSETCPILEYKGILRKGNEKDLDIVLQFKTKKELLEILSSIDSECLLTKKSLKNKSDIINSLKCIEEIKKINLPDYFYFLTDKWQVFKEFNNKEIINFKLFCLFNYEISKGHDYLLRIIKEYIKIDSMEIASRLREIFLLNINEFEGDPNFKRNNYMKEIENISIKN
ncbi:MAG: hypothetical protein H7Y00_02250 [Fimbriimonadaceae bacterium]|nr:hypothetical protein [Chitinophagales bacterium]